MQSNYQSKCNVTYNCSASIFSSFALKVWGSLKPLFQKLEPKPLKNINNGVI